MTTKDTALKLALETLEKGDLLCEVTAASILREAIAQPAEQANGQDECRRCEGIGIEDGVGDKCIACDGYGTTPHTPPAGVPDGYVPVEPTPEMLAALWAYKSDSLQDCYRAMLSAAPQPEAQEPSK